MIKNSTLEMWLYKCDHINDLKFISNWSEITNIWRHYSIPYLYIDKKYINSFESWYWNERIVVRELWQRPVAGEAKSLWCLQRSGKMLNVVLRRQSYKLTWSLIHWWCITSTNSWSWNDLNWRNISTRNSSPKLN